MFRKMRRFKQEISQEECIRVLKEQPRGVLSIMGEDGYPYGVPLDHWYDEKTGTICFHGAKEGHKIDALRKNNKVSYCVYDQGYRNAGEWALNIQSVIVFGTIHEVKDQDRAMEICRQLCLKFTDDQDYIEKEIKNAGSRVLCWEIQIDHMTGKLVNES